MQEIGQDWREDSSNRDLRHARNRVRHGIVPRLERTLNPSVRETLAETADIARSEEEYWQKEVDRVLPEVWQAERRTLEPAALAALPLALRRRVVRAAAESLGLRLEFRHVEEILDLDPQGAQVQPCCRKAGLFPWTKADCDSIPPARRRLRIRITSTGCRCRARFEVPEAGTRFEAALVSGERKLGL